VAVVANVNRKRETMIFHFVVRRRQPVETNWYGRHFSSDGMGHINNLTNRRV
jgi:hypothetical protein